MSRPKELPKIITVVGPTASGKTNIAIKLVREFSGELISVDSRQIYIGMDIGTAKDKSFPHHMVDIAEPTEIFSVAEFKKRALAIISEIVEKGKLPILVGGTGLYLDSILYNYNLPKTKADPKLREKLNQVSVEGLEERLESLDPQAASLARKNKRRLIRALEVIEKTGKSFSEQQQKGEKLFNALVIGISMSREKLVEKIEKRVEKQIKQGLIDEVRDLTKKYGETAYALKNTIGYKELLPHLRGEITLAEAEKEIKKDTRRYAKRQMTWFRRNKNINWIKDYSGAKKLAQKFL